MSIFVFKFWNGSREGKNQIFSKPRWFELNFDKKLYKTRQFKTAKFCFISQKRGSKKKKTDVTLGGGLNIYVENIAQVFFDSYKRGIIWSEGELISKKSQLNLDEWI